MNQACIYIYCFGFVFVFIYLLYITRSAMTFFIYRNDADENKSTDIFSVTVIVPARNESPNIIRCLEAIQKQLVKDVKVQIIISDDFSEDNTRELVNQFVDSVRSDFTWELITASGIGGKKAALERAIQQASGELIITTDADCTMGTGWMQSFINCFRTANADMITGLVLLEDNKSIWDHLQNVEAVMLGSLGAASIIHKKPLMCNGANMAFTKVAFTKAGGYSYGNNVPSGDDTFLMLRISKFGKLVFNKDEDSIVFTKPAGGLKQLLSQRKRWASKVRLYNESYIKHAGILIVVTNLFLVMAAILFAFNSWNLFQLLSVWIIKIVADFFLFTTSVHFTGQRKLFFLFLPAVVLYPFYALIMFVASAGNVKYEWKGRDYSVSKITNE